MRSVDTVWIPQRRSPLLVGAAVLASLVLVVGIVIVVRYLANDVLACSPPSQQEQQVQEAFVRSRVPDAQELNWTFSDCDADGTGSLSFTTALAPAATHDAFLAYTACSPYHEPSAGDNAVTCKSGGAQVFIFLEVAPSAKTKGELAL